MKKDNFKYDELEKNSFYRKANVETYGKSSLKHYGKVYFFVMVISH